MSTTIATKAIQTMPWIEPRSSSASLSATSQRYTSRRYDARLHERDDLERLRHALRFGDRIVGVVGHGCDATLRLR